jgi:hypothetical protein
MKIIVNILLSVCIISCAPEYCYDNIFEGWTDYPVNPSIQTPVLKIDVDFSGQKIDVATLLELDKQTQELLYCLGKDNFDLGCLVIKIASNWYISPCSGEQLFPCNIPESSCKMKGVEPTKECPCACRAVIQHHDVIITAPNLKLYKGELAKLVTGYWNPWAIEEIRKCL